MTDLGYLENKHLFNAVDEKSEYSATHHVAEMVGYLGLPPPHSVKRSETTRNVFDEHGQCHLSSFSSSSSLVVTWIACLYRC